MTIPSPATPDHAANPIRALAASLQQGADLPEFLPAALAAFDAIQDLARQHESADPDLYAAFMTAACAAGDGLDALATIPAGGQLPVAAPSGLAAGGPGQAADDIAELSAVLADRLERLEGLAVSDEQRLACQDAARSAREVHDVMAGRR